MAAHINVFIVAAVLASFITCVVADYCPKGHHKIFHPNGTFIRCKRCAVCDKYYGAKLPCDTRIVSTGEINVACKLCVLGKTFSSEKSEQQCQRCKICYRHEKWVGVCTRSEDNKRCTGSCLNEYYWDKNNTEPCQPCSSCGNAKNATRVSKCIKDGMPVEIQCKPGMINILRTSTVSIPITHLSSSVNVNRSLSTAAPIHPRTASTVHSIHPRTASTVTRISSTNTPTKSWSLSSTLIIVFGVIIILLIIILAMLICYFKKPYRRCKKYLRCSQSDEPVPVAISNVEDNNSDHCSEDMPPCSEVAISNVEDKNCNHGLEDTPCSVKLIPFVQNNNQDCGVEVVDLPDTCGSLSGRSTPSIDETTAGAQSEPDCETPLLNETTDSSIEMKTIDDCTLPSLAIGSLLSHVYQKVCRKLNHESPLDDDWTTMAGQMGFTVDDVRTLSTEKNPTDAVLCRWSRMDTANDVTRLIEILNEMGRKDVVEIIKVSICM